MNQGNKFNFFVPASIEKSGETGELFIKGIASGPSKDSDGENLDPSGFDFEPLLRSGYFNWNHQAQKSPGAILGRPTHARITESNEFYVEGFLYKGLEDAVKLYNLAQVLEHEDPERRLGFSIEGTATERDPINTKRVRRAVITGIAITHCPKNPNTLLSIIKGDYTTAFVAEDTISNSELQSSDLYNNYISRFGHSQYTPEHVREYVVSCYPTLPHEQQDVLMKTMCNMLDKSMSTANIPMKESVDGKPKHMEDSNVVEDVNNKPNISEMAMLSKAQVYTKIFEMTQNPEQADKIFDFINDTKNTMKLDNITDEVITKAKQILNLATSTEDTKEEEKTSEGKTDEEDEKEEEIKKSEETLKLDVVFEKSDIELMTLGFLQKGLNSERINIEFDKRGLDLDLYSDVVEKVCSEYVVPVTLQEGPELLTKADVSEVLEGTSTMIEKLVKSIKTDLTSFTETLKESIGDSVTEQTQLIKGFETTVLEVTKSNNILKGQIDTLNQELDQKEERLHELEKTPLPSKSITKSKQIERFDQSQDLDSNVYTLSLSKAEDRAVLVDRFFSEVEVLRGQNRDYKIFEKAINDLEYTKSLPASILPHAKRMGINIVQ